MSTLAPLLVGFGFGVCLQRAGLAHYDRIVNVFRFRDLTVLKFLLSALVTAAVGIRTLQSFGLASDVTIPTTFLVANLLGGLVFGAGMALSGFCPGTVAAGAGEGRLDYLIPGGLGLYSGAVVYGLEYERVIPWITRFGNVGNVTFAGLLHVEPWLVVLLFTEVTLLVFYVVERGLPLVLHVNARRGTTGASGAVRSGDRSRASRPRESVRLPLPPSR